MYRHYLIIISLVLNTATIFAQNNTANVYKGIWFTLGQFSAYGDKYSGGLGTYNYESESKLVYLNDLNFDEQGNPVILAVVSKGFEPGPKSDPRDWMIIHWKNEQPVHRQLNNQLIPKQYKHPFIFR